MDNEIQDALKQFQATASIEQLKNVQQPQQENHTNSKMAGWVMKISGGLIKEERQAEYVLLVFVLLLILTSLYFFFTGSKNSVKSPSLDLINRPQPSEGFMPN